jgi:hypothetical protein
VLAQEPPADVTKAVERRAQALSQCLSPEEGALKVRLKVRLRVDGTGAFREVRIVDGTLSPQAQSCIVRILEGVRLDDAPSSSTVVDLPLELGR